MYSAALLRNGFDDLGKLSTVEDTDLRGMGIPPTHALHLRKKLFESRAHEALEPPRSEHPVVTFLHGAGVGQYADVFLAGGFEDMETLVLIDDQDLKDLGVQRGHIVKLRRRLREYQMPQAPPAPVAPQQPAVTQAPVLPPCGHWPPAPSPAAVPVPPPSHGLEAGGLSALERSWQEIEMLGTCVVGEVLFRHMFALAPEAAAMFPPEVRARYQEWTAHEPDETMESDVLKSVALRRIFGKIVNAVGCTVAGLHDMHKLVPMVVKLGVRHYHYGVREAHLRVLSKALELTLQDVLGDGYTPEVRHAWAIVFNLISSLMSESFRQVADRHGDHDVNFMRFHAAPGRHKLKRAGAARNMRNLEVQVEEEEQEQESPARGLGLGAEPEAEFPAPESPESLQTPVAVR